MEDSNFEALEEIRTLKKHNKEIPLIKQEVKDLCSICDELVQLKQPLVMYSRYLKEQFLKWQVKRIKKGLPYILETGANYIRAYFEATE